MFEAVVQDGNMWKKVIDSIKDLVEQANMDCSPAGISIQAMDTAHVALVHLILSASGFTSYQCENNAILGLSLISMAKVLKTCDGGDTVALRREDDADTFVVQCESKDNRKSSCFTLKLLEIDAESMGVPEMEYRNSISIPSSEFTRICRDMSILGETVTIDISSEGVKFSAAGDLGEGYALLRVDGSESPRTVVKRELKSEGGVKVEGGVKKEEDPDDMPLAQRYAPAMANPIKDEAGAGGSGGGKGSKSNDGVQINTDGPITLSFALRYLNTFAKASALSDRITMHFAPDSPCMVQFKIEGFGFLRFYLAPKVDEAADN